MTLDESRLRGASVTRPDAILEGTLHAHWDARVVSYDARAFSFAEWALEAARSIDRRVRSLETIHEALAPDEAYRLAKSLCAATQEPEFQRMLRSFVQSRIAVDGHLVGPLAVQRFLNVRVMLPDRPQGVFPFHTGLLYGHGAASRSLWLPLTDVRAPEMASASLQIVGLDRSRRLVREAARARMSVAEMTAFFGRESWPVSAGPGDVLLFTQENLHGNFVNTTGRTRVSIDFRVAEARFGDHLARKVPGGYFELMQEEPRANAPVLPTDAFTSHVIYLNNNTCATAGVPVHLQRLQVVDYCREQGIDIDFEYFELETLDYLPTLAHAVSELEANVVLYSAYALPHHAEDRRRILRMAIERGIVLHLVNERMVVRDGDGVARLERLLAFARHDG